jgi:hypothetical protein
MAHHADTLKHVGGSDLANYYDYSERITCPHCGEQWQIGGYTDYDEATNVLMNTPYVFNGEPCGCDYPKELYEGEDGHTYWANYLPQ